MKKERPPIDKNAEWQKFLSHADGITFRELFNCFFKPLYGYGIKLCNQPELVKDCIQELFRNLWERRDDLAHIESPNVYLFVSLRRKILKERANHRKKRNNLNEIDGNGFIQFAKEDLIIRDEVKYQKREELKDALNQLPDRQKEVIFLHFYNGMSYGEIEEILSINRQSVRNHVYRAMETLRTLLDTEIMKLVVSLLITFLFFG
ncbi:MAG TPA: sigma-70 family RNA polymerase sigma factor [Balneolaceae bacterium]|nr:sigma-70 family RNA polymerase sigma factor [Balneolaceae bacterium]